MQSNEYEYNAYEEQNEREDEALRRRERADETNPPLHLATVEILRIFDAAVAKVRRAS